MSKTVLATLEYLYLTLSRDVLRISPSFDTAEGAHASISSVEYFETGCAYDDDISCFSTMRL